MANVMKSNLHFPLWTRLSAGFLPPLSRRLSFGLSSEFGLLLPAAGILALAWAGLKLKKVSASRVLLSCPEASLAEIPKLQSPELCKYINAVDLCMADRQPTANTLPTCSCRLEALVLETLACHNRSGLEGSSLAVEHFWRRPGINDFSDSVGNGNNLGVHG